MRILVRILRGKRRGRVGTIAGKLNARNPYVTKAAVKFSDDEWATYDLDAIVACGPDKVQGELGI